MFKTLKYLFIGGIMLINSGPSNADVVTNYLNNRAQRTTLPILTPAGSGSITIIGKTGSNYTFLTSAHVIANTYNGEENSIDVSSQAGRELFVPALIKKNFVSEGLDLAVGTFQYSGNSKLAPTLLFPLAPDTEWEDDPSQYKTETLPCNDKSIHRLDRCIRVRQAGGDCYYTNVGKKPCDKYPTINYTKRLSMGTYDRRKGAWNGMNYFVKTGTIGNFVVAGYSLPTRSITERIFRVSNAVPKELLRRNKNGYNLIYETTSTVPGMSGGPVLGVRLCPKKDRYTNAGLYPGIVGIHGRSEEYGNTQSRSGISLGVPISDPKVIRFLTSNSKSLGIPVNTIYQDAVNSICS